MAIVSTKELARTFEREVGRPAIVKRRFVVVLSDDTLTTTRPTEVQIIAAATGISIVNNDVPLFGAAHPTIGGWKARKAIVNEGFENSPYHVEVIVEYGLVLANELLAPVDREAVWNFESSNTEVPALFYYDGSTKYPLTNSAYDYFPGLTTEETVVRISIQKNFAEKPASWVQANHAVNNSAYLGAAAGAIKVAGVNSAYKTEVFGGEEKKYWDTTATLIYRQSGHSLQLPDIGWNFIDGGQKRRAMVFDFQNSEWIASPTPVGLNGSGAQTGGAPAILVRRVNPEADFQALFGTPPP